MKKKLLIFLIAFIGFLTTIKLAIIYHEANYNPYALSSFCSINSYVDCDGVAKTSASQFLGIPLSYWGMFLYLFIIMLLFADKLKNMKFLNILSVFKRPLDYIASLGLISFFISIILALESVFSLEKICILCFFTYILNTLIALIATDFNNGGFITSVKNSFIDFIFGVKEYTKQFIIAIVLIVLFLTYTEIFQPFAPQVKKERSIAEFSKLDKNPYAVSGNYLGNPNSKIRVDFYSDFTCPMCAVYSIMLHKAVQELGNVYVVPHELPLDKTCNIYLKTNVHKNACNCARYAIAAKKQGKYWDMASNMIEKRITDDKIALKYAQNTGLDINKYKHDIKSTDTMNIIKSDIDSAMELGIKSTPTIVVNGKIYLGLKPYYELKEILKSNE